MDHGVDRHALPRPATSTGAPLRVDCNHLIPGQIESIAGSAKILPQVKSDTPYPSAFVEIQPAEEAYELVLANAGAMLPLRDAVDERIINTVRTGQITVKVDEKLIEDLSHAGFTDKVVNAIADLVEKGIITDVAQVGGYPRYAGTPYKDTDSDGMPDVW